MLELLLVIAIACAAILGVQSGARRIGRKMQEDPQFWVISLATLILLVLLYVTGFPLFTDEPANRTWLK